MMVFDFGFCLVGGFGVMLGSIAHVGAISVKRFEKVTIRLAWRISWLVRLHRPYKLERRIVRYGPPGSVLVAESGGTGYLRSKRFSRLASAHARDNGRYALQSALAFASRTWMPGEVCASKLGGEALAAAAARPAGFFVSRGCGGPYRTILDSEVIKLLRLTRPSSGERRKPFSAARPAEFLVGRD